MNKNPELTLLHHSYHDYLFISSIINFNIYRIIVQVFHVLFFLFLKLFIYIILMQAPLKVNTSCGRGTSNAQLMPRQKDTVSRMPAGRISSDDQSDSSRKLPRSCDVCRRSETPLIPVLVCSSCKVLYVLYWALKLFTFVAKY